MHIIHKKHRDAQRAAPAAKCALCGGEIYPGERSWRAWGRVLCGDCARPWPAVLPAHLGEVRP